MRRRREPTNPSYITRAPSAQEPSLHSHLKFIGRVAGPDDTRQTQLAADNRAMTSAAAAIGHDGRGFFHDRFPGGIGHRGYQHRAFLKFGQLTGI